MTELPQVPPEDAQPRPRCIHLQSNSMVVHGEGFAGSSEYQDGMAHFWCLQTGRALGPDNDTVSMKNCCNPERGCHQEY